MPLIKALAIFVVILAGISLQVKTNFMIRSRFFPIFFVMQDFVLFRMDISRTWRSQLPRKFFFFFFFFFIFFYFFYFFFYYYYYYFVFLIHPGLFVHLSFCCRSAFNFWRISYAGCRCIVVASPPLGKAICRRDWLKERKSAKLFSWGPGGRSLDDSTQISTVIPPSFVRIHICGGGWRRKKVDCS